MYDKLFSTFTWIYNFFFSLYIIWHPAILIKIMIYYMVVKKFSVGPSYHHILYLDCFLSLFFCFPNFSWYLVLGSFQEMRRRPKGPKPCLMQLNAFPSVMIDWFFLFTVQPKFQFTNAMTVVWTPFALYVLMCLPFCLRFVVSLQSIMILLVVLDQSYRFHIWKATKISRGAWPIKKW